MSLLTMHKKPAKKKSGANHSYSELKKYLKL